MKTIIWSVIYFLIGIAYIILEPHATFYQGIAVKTLIIPVLVIIFLLNLRQKLNHLCGLMLAGLFFSIAGDISIEFSFITGLVCFLTAHILYMTTFFLTPGENIILHESKWSLIPVTLYGAGFIWFLYGDLKEMLIPVILYSLVILTMLSAAINRMKKVNQESYRLVLAGAVLFVISDSAIALDKFSFPFKSSTMVIMSTYISAQYLIILGFIRQMREKTI